MDVGLLPLVVLNVVLIDGVGEERVGSPEWFPFTGALYRRSLPHACETGRCGCES